MSESDPSFLFINVARIGDTLFATPAMRAVAAARPGCHITALAHPKRAEVLEGLPFVEHVGGITKKTAPWRGRFGGRRYDYALVYGFDAALVAYALRVADRVVAFRQKDDVLNRRLYRCVEVPPPQSKHAVPFRLSLTDAIAIPPAGRRLAYQVTPGEDASARARLAADVPRGASPLVGLHVATFPKKTFRRWPIEHFALLAERIIGQWPGAHFLIYGGNEEPERTRWLKERLAARATHYAGRLSLRETGALMSLTDLYVGLDTGPTYVMSAFDIPLVVLYHCRIPSRYVAPLDHPCCYVLDHPRLDRDDCTEETSMSEIAVETVYAAVQKALAEHPPRTSA
jgi:heptosyltransferase-3